MQRVRLREFMDIKNRTVSRWFTATTKESLREGRVSFRGICGEGISSTERKLLLGVRMHFLRRLPGTLGNSLQVGGFLKGRSLESSSEKNLGGRGIELRR